MKKGLLSLLKCNEIDVPVHRVNHKGKAVVLVMMSKLCRALGYGADTSLKRQKDLSVLFPSGYLTPYNGKPYVYAKDVLGWRALFHGNVLAVRNMDPEFLKELEKLYNDDGSMEGLSVTMDMRDPRELTPHPASVMMFGDPTPEEYTAILESIREKGVRVPLEVDEDGTILSGYIRWKAAIQIMEESSGTLAVPVRVITGLGKSDNKIRHMVESNFQRRSLDLSAKVRSVRAWAHAYEAQNGKSPTSTALSASLGIAQSTAFRYLQYTALPDYMVGALDAQVLFGCQLDKYLKWTNEDTKQRFETLLEHNEGVTRLQVSAFFRGIDKNGDQLPAEEPEAAETVAAPEDAPVVEPETPPESYYATPQDATGTEETPMRVAVQLTETSQPIRHYDVVNTYTKGPFYCVYDGSNVYKYPVAHIFRIIETY